MFSNTVQWQVYFCMFIAQEQHERFNSICEVWQHRLITKTSVSPMKGKTVFPPKWVTKEIGTIIQLSNKNMEYEVMKKQVKWGL